MKDLTIQQIATLLNTTVSVLRNCGVTPQDRGKYDLADAIQKYIDKKTGTAQERDIKEEQLRLVKEQANLKEIERKTLEGELIYIEDAISIMTGNIMSAKKTLLAIPSRHASKLCAIGDVKEMIKELNNILDKALTELALDTSEIEKATEKRTGKRMADTAADDVQPVGKSKLKTK